MGGLLTTIIIEPFYNALILLMDFITPSLGLAVIILTIIFRLILFPLSRKQIITQIKMRDIQEPIKKLREEYKDKPEEMGKEMMKLYKENGVNPLSGILLLLIQLPLLIGFYYVFLRAGLPDINFDYLYAAVPAPEFIDVNFLGIDLTKNSAILAALGGITQYFQAKLLIPDDDKNHKGGKQEAMEEMMKGVQKQMVYVMPIILTFISYTFGAIIALYILVGNLFSIAQELYIREKIRKPLDKEISQ